MPPTSVLLDNYRRRARWKSLTAAEKKTLAAVASELSTVEEEVGQDAIELVDVIDAATAVKVYLLALWPFGSGVLVDLETKNVVADVAQHHFDARGQSELRLALEVAWKAQGKALGIRESVSFVPGPEGIDDALASGAVTAPKKAASAGAESPSADRLETMRAKVLGPAPPGPLDVPVVLGDVELPAWNLVHDAVHDLRPPEEVATALATLSPPSATAVFRVLASAAVGGLTSGGQAKPPPGAQPGSPVARGAHAQRYLRFVIALAERLGDDATRVANEILAARADWLARWLPQLMRSPGMTVPHWLEQCVALGVLARAAAMAGSSLEPAHDALLGALARYHDATYPLAIVLAELPASRAGEIARADLGLIERFPSVESTPAAIERFEASGGGPFMEALFKRVVTAIGPGAIPALEAAIERGSPQKKVLVKCLSLVGKAGARPKTRSR